MTTRRLHKDLVKNKKLVKRKAFNFKFHPEEAKQIKKIADRYCGGSMTALFRVAIKNFKPKARDLVKV